MASDSELLNSMFQRIADALSPEMPPGIVAIRPFMSRDSGIDQILGERINDRLKDSLRKTRVGTEFVDRTVIDQIYYEWVQSGRVPDSDESVRILRGKTSAQLLMFGKGYLNDSQLCLRFEVFDIETTLSVAGSGEHCQIYSTHRYIQIGNFDNRDGEPDENLKILASSLVPISKLLRLKTTDNSDWNNVYLLTGKVLRHSVSFEDNRKYLESAKSWDVPAHIIGEIPESQNCLAIEYAVSLLEENNGDLTIKIGSSSTCIAESDNIAIEMTRISREAITSAVIGLFEELEN